MAARKKKATRARAAQGRGARALTRLEHQMPDTLAEFTKRVQTRLGRLEREIDRAEARTRRRIVRALREASRTLGRIEAEGERRWRDIAGGARREALGVLHRIEAVLEEGQGKSPARTRAKRATRKRSAARRTTGRAAAGRA